MRGSKRIGRRSLERRLHALVTGFLIVAGTQVTHAVENEYRSDEFGYSLTMPDGWVQMPDDIVQEFTRAMVKPGSTIYFDAGFQPVAVPRWFTYPYVLVQIVQYSDYGMSRQPTESEARILVERMANTDLDEALEKVTSDEFKNLNVGSVIGKAFYDKATHRFEYPVNIEVSTVGKIRGACTGYVGQNAMIQVFFYALDSDWKEQQETQITIAKSFALDAAAAYDPSMNSIFGEGILGGAIRGALFGGIGGLAVYLFRRKKSA